MAIIRTITTRRRKTTVVGTTRTIRSIAITTAATPLLTTLSDSTPEITASTTKTTASISNPRTPPAPTASPASSTPGGTPPVPERTPSVVTVGQLPRQGPVGRKPQ